MSIYELRDNLKNTIAGKELLLAEYDNRKGKAAEHAKAFLQINVEELKRILVDVEICCKEAADASWAANPDRMGGAFTQEEIDNASTWR